jgi:hypothetical protein
MGDPNSRGLVEKGLAYLDGFGQAIYSLTEITRIIEMNAEGL